MLPQEFTERMQALLGTEYEAFLHAYDLPRNVGLRINPLKTAQMPPLPFSLSAVPWEPNGYYYDPIQRPGLHPYHEAGVYYLQEPSAMAPARLLDPQPGDRVLDLCAAPGGKSTQLAAAMCGRGLLVCNEIHPKRARILSQNIERLGICNALVLNETPAKLAQRFPRYFDKILVDAPCSGEGMYRKEAAAVEDWSLETVQMCARRQLEILQYAAAMLAPGGRLVYSTCTFAPDENEGVVSTFLHTHPAFSIEAPPNPYFSPGRPDWIAQPAPGLEHTFRLWPHKLRGEGHYAAVMRLTEGQSGAVPTQTPDRLPQTYQNFCKETLIAPPEGIPVQFGQTLYIAPAQLPDLHGLKVLRAGLEAGQDKKNYFLPAHALALWLKEAQQTIRFAADSAQIAGYLRGETLSAALKGWVLVCVDDYSLGWAKGTDHVLKNHFPKGLRRV